MKLRQDDAQAGWHSARMTLRQDDVQDDAQDDTQDDAQDDTQDDTQEHASHMASLSESLLISKHTHKVILVSQNSQFGTEEMEPKI